MSLNYPEEVNLNEDFIYNLANKNMSEYAIDLETAQKMAKDIVKMREALRKIHQSTYVRDYDYVHKVIDGEYHALFNNIKVFKAIDHATLMGRGLAFNVNIPNPERIMSPKGLPKKKELIIINNRKYIVVAVEGSVNLTDPPFLAENITLIVKEVSE